MIHFFSTRDKLIKINPSSTSQLYYAFKIGFIAVTTNHKISVAKHCNFSLMLYTPNRSTDSHLGTWWLRDSCYTLHRGHQRVTEGASFWRICYLIAAPSGICSLLRHRGRERESCKPPISNYRTKLHVYCAHSPLARTSAMAPPNYEVGRKHYPPMCLEGENRTWVSLRSLNLCAPKELKFPNLLQATLHA